MKMMRIKISPLYLWFWALILAEQPAQTASSPILKREWPKSSDEVIRKTFQPPFEHTPSIGTVKFLVVRIGDSNGDEPENDAKKLSDLFFGTHGNTLIDRHVYDAATFFDSCSGGKMKVVPAVGSNVIDGVIDITIDIDETIPTDGQKCAAFIEHHYREKFHKLNAELQIKYDHVAFIPPSANICGVDGGLGGGINSIYFANSENLPINMIGHEVGHALGLGHSSTIENGQNIEYGDHSCIMGDGAPHNCFNGAMSWDLGWYSDKNKEGHLDLFDFDKYGLFWSGRLVSFDDYVNDLFDDSQDRVIVRLHNLYIHFNRKKGITKGTRVYADKVVVNQRGEVGNSDSNSVVKAVLDDYSDINTFMIPHFTSQNLNIVIKVCSLDIQNRKIRPVGIASQSSTWENLVASNAVDGNGGTISETKDWDGDWWQFEFWESTIVQRVVVFNIPPSFYGGDWHEKLDNSVVKLLDENGVELAQKKIHGTNIESITLDFEQIHSVKIVKIEAAPNQILILQQVDFYGAIQPERASADYANVISYISDNENMDLYACDTKPSKVPDGVKLIRNSEQCVEENATNDHPKRFKCPIQATSDVSSPGSYGNPGLLLYTKKNKAWGCTIAVQPVYWSYGGHSFYFESRESLHEINECFNPGSTLEANIPPKPTPAIPSNVMLVRSDDPCFFEEALKWGDSPEKERYGCPISKTEANWEPFGYDNPAITLYGHDCGIELSPQHWSAYEGSEFYFTSTKDLETINACFVSGVHLTQHPPLMVEKKPDGSSCNNSFECKSLICNENICGKHETPPVPENPTPVIPSNVKLVRTYERCYFVNAWEYGDWPYVDCFECPIKDTVVNSDPDDINSPSFKLYGNNCGIELAPLHWSLHFSGEGMWFYFTSSENLNTINACFSPGVHLTEHVGEKAEAKERFIRKNLHAERKIFSKKNWYQQDRKERRSRKNNVGGNHLVKESASSKNLHVVRKHFSGNNMYLHDRKERFFRKNFVGDRSAGKESFLSKNSHGEKKDFLDKNFYKQDRKERVFRNNLVSDKIEGKENFARNGERKDFPRKNWYQQDRKERVFRKSSVGDKSKGKGSLSRTNLHGERKDFLDKNHYQQERKE